MVGIVSYWCVTLSANRSSDLIESQTPSSLSFPSNFHLSRFKERTGKEKEQEIGCSQMRKALPRATDDDDDTPTPAPVARRARPAAADDEDDDAPAVAVGRRGAAASGAAAATTTQDPAAGDAPPVVRRRVAAASDATAATGGAPAAGAATATAAAAPTAAAVAVVDYDALTYEQFLAQLRATTREQCIANAAAARRLAAGGDGAVEGDAEVARPAEAFPDQSGGYSYTVLLDRVYEELHLKNPHLSGGDAARSQLPQPIIERHGAKKTAVANFQKICEALHRTLDEVKDYIDKELSTQSALDGNNCLLMKLQNVKSTQFENVVLKYVAEFVKCNSCRSLDTELAKDAERRMLLLRCSNCKAERNVKSSSQGFKAETGKRSKARAAAL
jgi:translation initiation factor 2 subunit 2